APAVKGAGTSGKLAFRLLVQWPAWMFALPAGLFTKLFVPTEPLDPTAAVPPSLVMRSPYTLALPPQMHPGRDELRAARALSAYLAGSYWPFVLFVGSVESKLSTIELAPPISMVFLTRIA